MCKSKRGARFASGLRCAVINGHLVAHVCKRKVMTLGGESVGSIYMWNLFLGQESDRERQGKIELELKVFEVLLYVIELCDISRLIVEFTSSMFLAYDREYRYTYIRHRQQTK